MALNARKTDSIDLLTAINECGALLLPCIALLYTPDWCGFAQVELIEGSIKLSTSTAEDGRFDQATIFEARVFNERAELRWMKHWPGDGRAALISEENISSYLTHDAESWPDVEPFNQPYLLWGEGTTRGGDLPANWSRLAMARIGALDVPYPLNPNVPAVREQEERIYLVAREYLATTDDHGNVSVVDERLLKLVNNNELTAMGKAELVKLEEYA